MKRGWIIFGVVITAFFAVWAYRTSGKTRVALAELSSIERKIDKEQEHIEILRAEWAILNRPERLRFLVNEHKDLLGLQQIVANNYGEATQVPYLATPETDDVEYIDPADIEAILLDLIEAGEVDLP